MSDNPNQQGAWLMERVGFVTASRFKHVMAFKKATKGNAPEPMQARQDYLMQVVTERLTFQPTPSFVNSAMQWGIDQEGFARQKYVERTDSHVELTGFVRHSIPWVGASPDGLVGFDGLVEFKCPTSVTHVQTILNGMSDDHLPQVQGQMWVTGAQWCDFVSYDPRLPPGMEMYIQRIPRNDEYIALLENHVRVFLAEVETVIETLEEKLK